MPHATLVSSVIVICCCRKHLWLWALGIAEGPKAANKLIPSSDLCYYPSPSASTPQLRTAAPRGRGNTDANHHHTLARSHVTSYMASS